MKTTCLINSFNYVRYLPEAIDSALKQTQPFDEVIVVDDGSTDGSRELLFSRYALLPQVQIVAKANGGQLSCFNAGFRRATGDIIFFLDADDVYCPNYVTEVLNTYSRQPAADCVFTGLRRFGQVDDVQLPHAADRDFGYAAIAVLFGSDDWVGAPTSCLSLRRSLLERWLPLPLERDWRTRADDCLVYGCDVAGGRKYYLAQPLVHYRVHGQNHFSGKQFDATYNYQRRLNLARLFGWLQQHLGYDLNRLLAYAGHEFASRPEPTFKDFKHYWRLVGQSSIEGWQKRQAWSRILGHYLSHQIPWFGRLVARQRAAKHARRQLPQTCSAPLAASPPANLANVDAA